MYLKDGAVSWSWEALAGALALNLSNCPSGHRASPQPLLGEACIKQRGFDSLPRGVAVGITENNVCEKPSLDCKHKSGLHYCGSFDM